VIDPFIGSSSVRAKKAGLTGQMNNDLDANPKRRWLASHWRCPRCGGIVRVEAEAAWCENDACRYAKSAFPVLGRQPALVDFDASVLDESDLRSTGGQSDIAHTQGSGRQRIRRLLFGGNHVAKLNSARFLKLLKGSTTTPVLLVVGGGTKGVGADALYNDPAVMTVSFDIYASSNTQFVADAHAIPLSAESVDGVWIQAVLEHVLTPAAVVAEIRRVLKNGGFVYADTPFMQQVHMGPWDFTRYTESGHRWLFRDFTRIDSGVVIGPGTALVWSIRYAVAAVFRSRAAGTVVGAAFFWLRFLDYISAPRFALDAASAVFFMGTKAQQPISPKDAIAHYQGAGR
jgi:SAM-dependent methyltransferase